MIPRRVSCFVSGYLKLAASRNRSGDLSLVLVKSHIPFVTVLRKVSEF